jgi:hypothetical protein
MSVPVRSGDTKHISFLALRGLTYRIFITAEKSHEKIYHLVVVGFIQIAQQKKAAKCSATPLVLGGVGNNFYASRRPC